MDNNITRGGRVQWEVFVAPPPAERALQPGLEAYMRASRLARGLPSRIGAAMRW
jgi:hypothetical protein